MTVTKKKKAKWLQRDTAMEEAVLMCKQFKSYTPKKAVDKVLMNQEYIQDRQDLTEGGYNLFLEQVKRRVKPESE